MNAIIRKNYANALIGLNGHGKDFAKLATRLVPESHVLFVLLNMAPSEPFNNAELQQVRKELRNGQKPGSNGVRFYYGYEPGTAPADPQQRATDNLLCAAYQNIVEKDMDKISKEELKPLPVFAINNAAEKAAEPVKSISKSAKSESAINVPLWEKFTNLFKVGHPVLTFEFE